MIWNTTSITQATGRLTKRLANSSATYSLNPRPSQRRNPVTHLFWIPQLPEVFNNERRTFWTRRIRRPHPNVLWTKHSGEPRQNAHLCPRGRESRRQNYLHAGALSVSILLPDR